MIDTALPRLITTAEPRMLSSGASDAPSEPPVSTTACKGRFRGRGGGGRSREEGKASLQRTLTQSTNSETHTTERARAKVTGEMSAFATD